MYEALLRIEYDSTYAALTDSGDIELDLWCNGDWDRLYLRGDITDERIRRLVRDVDLYATVRSDDDAMLFTETCLKDHGDQFLETRVERHGCRVLPPLHYEDGHIQLRVIANESESLTALYRELGNEYAVHVEAKREFTPSARTAPVFLPGDALPALSERQREALSLALGEGYYSIPRAATTRTLAAAMDIDRRTFEDHLRRAEQKVIESFVGDRRLSGLPS